MAKRGLHTYIVKAYDPPVDEYYADDELKNLISDAELDSICFSNINDRSLNKSVCSKIMKRRQG